MKKDNYGGKHKTSLMADFFPYPVRKWKQTF